MTELTREKKLREGIEKAMDHIGRGNYNRAFYCLEEVFYPEEGTPQIKPLNNEDMQASQAFINRAMKEEEAK